MKDTAEKQSSIDPVLLTGVPSGKRCVLVGISNDGRWGAHGRHEHPIYDATREEIKRHKKHSRGRDIKKHGRKGHFEHGGKEWGSFRRLRVLRRLLDLGITKGCSFEVIHASTSGPILVEVRGTRVALGQGLASKMFVKVVDA